MLTGEHSKSVTFSSTGRPYLDGTFDDRYECKFVLVKATLATSRAIWFEIIRIQAPYLLTPLYVSECQIENEAKSVFAFAFDTTFVERKVRHSFFSKSQGKMNKWWRDFARNALATMATMHKKEVHHGQLDQEKSYAMVGDDVCFVKTEQVDGNKRGDLLGFRTFLKRLRQQDADDTSVVYVSEEWNNFLYLLEYCPADHLRKHPLLLDGEETCHLTRQIIDHMNLNMSKVVKKIFETEVNKMQFYHWDSSFDGLPALGLVYNYDGRAHGCETPWDLLTFFRKVVEHYSEQNDQLLHLGNQHFRKRLPLRIVGEQLTVLFPGFLSRIYEIVISLREIDSDISTRRFA